MAHCWSHNKFIKGSKEVSIFCQTNLGAATCIQSFCEAQLTWILGRSWQDVWLSWNPKASQDGTVQDGSGWFRIVQDGSGMLNSSTAEMLRFVTVDLVPHSSTMFATAGWKFFGSECSHGFAPRSQTRPQFVESLRGSSWRNPTDLARPQGQRQHTAPCAQLGIGHAMPLERSRSSSCAM